jgi:hypothetical protein
VDEYQTRVNQCPRLITPAEYPNAGAAPVFKFKAAALAFGGVGWMRGAGDEAPGVRLTLTRAGGGGTEWAAGG